MDKTGARPLLTSLLVTTLRRQAITDLYTMNAVLGIERDMEAPYELKDAVKDSIMEYVRSKRSMDE